MTYRKLKKKLNEAEISVYDADDIFEKNGVMGASLLPLDKLKTKYIELVKKHHPDKGGDTRIMQDINSAYDALKNGGKKTNNTEFDQHNTNINPSTSKTIYDIRKEKLILLAKYLKQNFSKKKNNLSFSVKFIKSMGGMLSIEIGNESFFRNIHISHHDDTFEIDNPMDSIEIKYINDNDEKGIFNYLINIIENRRRK